MSSFVLKMIAVISMTIDHFNKIIGQFGLEKLFPALSMDITYPLCQMMERVGRLSFPIFAFLIAEGARKTRSMPRYIGRLALLAVISEPIFFFAFNWRMNPGWADWMDNLSRLNLNNVFVTHVLGAAAIYACQRLEKKYAKLRYWGTVPVLLLAMFAAGYVGADYGAMGVLLIAALYFAREKSHKAAVVVLWSLGLYMYQLSVFNLLLSAFSAASAILICGYNGKRGKIVKWGFYFYYPLHLLILLLCSKQIFF